MSRGPGDRSEQCREIFARLSEYLDGELDPEMCTKLEGHVEDCAPCIAFLESLRRTIRLVGAVEQRPLPEQLRRELTRAYVRLRDGSPPN